MCHAHAAQCLGLEKLLSEQHGHGMACLNQTWPHCVNQMGKTQSKSLAARHGMCKSAFSATVSIFSVSASSAHSILKFQSSSLPFHNIRGVSKKFSEWYQKTNKTEDTNK
jgi:hypothetical protein